MHAASAQPRRRPIATRRWKDYGGGPDSSKFVALDQITKSNVSRLQVAWTYPTGDNNVYSFNPIVVDNVMYVLARNNSLVALERGDGQGDLDPREPARHRAARHQLLGEQGSARTAGCSSR